MRILLIAATSFELGELPQLFHQKSYSKNYFEHDLNGHDIDLLVTGIGSVMTTYTLTNALRKKQYSLVMNIGIAGSYTEELRIGSVVNIIEDQFVDLGIEDGTRFSTLFDARLVDKNEPPFIDGIIRAGVRPDSVTLSRLIKVLGATVNTVTGSETSKNRLMANFCIDVESMEGAACFYVCQLEGVPCIQIRAISNLVEQRDKNQWNPELAMANLTGKVHQIIQEITAL